MEKMKAKHGNTRTYTIHKGRIRSDGFAHAI